MASDQVKRKLAAILAADIAGFSRLMGVDEAGTLVRLKEYRRELIDPKNKQYRGRVVKTTGDGILIEFPSVVDAVCCSIEVQEGMRERNADVPPEKRIEFRIGINLGDVIVEGRDLYGEGVNIAARLEGLAEPGGICISQTVLNHARGKFAFEVEDLGQQALKNIVQPIHVYRVLLNSSRGRTVTGSSESPLALPDKPSIAVLPFQNMSCDPEQEYLADGITEDIITALTRFRWLFVIARNSSFAYKHKSLDAKQIAQQLGVEYLIEGSVRKSGQRIRISAQLVEATSGKHVWAERYDLELTEVFAIQDEVAERVAGAIEPELLKTEGAHAAARHAGNITAWDLVRRGTWHFHQVTRENHLKARELFRQACKLDPELPEAHLWIGRVSAGVVAYGWSDKPVADLQEGTEAALQAVQLDERNSYTHYALAIVSVYADRFEQSIGAARKAIEISPSFALGHLVLGMALLFSGHASEAIAPLEYGLRLSPYDPQNFVWFNILALARLFSGRAEAGLEAAARAQQVRPNWWTSLEVLVCCYAALEKWDEARRCARQMASVTKQPGDVLAPFKAHNPTWTEQMESALRRASA
ncbi:adenylate/guanylate cyclase domain-containing protein [Bradyrhizobium niftali]|jgi:adenylate cyclase|nr:adenylate/guanylate cyclase domain-containing protein [Bradyrhizobium niftali]